MATLHGGKVVAKAIKAEGIDHIFTLCGGHIQAIYDGCLDEGIRVVDTRHEQSAAHAADGWTRVTGKPGVAAVTAGPGVTDSVTAVANAFRAQVPMVLIGGQGAQVLGPFGGKDRGALQEMNHVELMRPVTKWATSVPETRRLGEYMQSAFRIATSGVPGPVFLEMPMDVLMGEIEQSEVIQYEGYRTESAVLGDPVAAKEAADAILKAGQPMLIVGSQYRWSRNLEGLANFLDKAPIPAYLSGMARGALPKTHPSLFRRSRSKALQQADLVIVAGTPLDFRLGYGEKIPAESTLIQIDLDGEEIGRNRKVDIGIVGDVGHVLGQIAEAMDDPCPACTDWRLQLADIEDEIVAGTVKEIESNVEPINPMRLCAEINKFIDEDTIVIGDGGDFVATASYILDVEGMGSWMDPGPLGTLGVGPGYAMAAKLAKPDTKVVLIMGDGSFGFNGMEFESMVRQGIKVVGIIGNDAAWTQILRGQAMLYGEDRVVATTLDYTRYDQVVEGLGGHGEYVEKLDDLYPALKRAFDSDKAALVNVKIGGSDFRKYAMSV